MTLTPGWQPHRGAQQRHGCDAETTRGQRDGRAAGTSRGRWRERREWLEDAQRIRDALGGEVRHAASAECGVVGAQRTRSGRAQRGLDVDSETPPTPYPEVSRREARPAAPAGLGVKGRLSGRSGRVSAAFSPRVHGGGASWWFGVGQRGECSKSRKIRSSSSASPHSNALGEPRISFSSPHPPDELTLGAAVNRYSDYSSESGPFPSREQIIAAMETATAR